MKKVLIIILAIALVPATVTVFFAYENRIKDKGAGETITKNIGQTIVNVIGLIPKEYGTMSKERKDLLTVFNEKFPTDIIVLVKTQNGIIVPAAMNKNDTVGQGFPLKRVMTTMQSGFRFINH